MCVSSMMDDIERRVREDTCVSVEVVVGVVRVVSVVASMMKVTARRTEV